MPKIFVLRTALHVLAVLLVTRNTCWRFLAKAVDFARRVQQNVPFCGLSLFARKCLQTARIGTLCFRFRKCFASFSWNILSDSGVRVGVVNWWLTWPAEEVNGFIVSDKYRRTHDQPYLTYP
jgi:hypothetical protein